MNPHDWGVVVGVAISLALALLPWMFLIHGKLARLIAQVEDMRADIAEIRDNHLAHIYARLGKMPCPTHEVRLTAIEKRMERE